VLSYPPWLHGLAGDTDAVSAAGSRRAARSRSTSTPPSGQAASRSPDTPARAGIARPHRKGTGQWA